MSNFRTIFLIVFVAAANASVAQAKNVTELCEERSAAMTVVEVAAENLAAADLANAAHFDPANPLGIAFQRDGKVFEARLTVALASLDQAVGCRSEGKDP